MTRPLYFWPPAVNVISSPFSLPSAVSALEIYDQVYTARKVDTTALRAVSPRRPAPAADAARAKAQIGEALTHLAFYAGWPKATKALTAVTRTLGK